MSEDRTVRSFNIREDDAEWLDSRENVNASGVVRDLLREYVTLGKAPEAALSLRVSEINADIKDRQEKIARLKAEIDELSRQRDDIRDRLKYRQREKEDVVESVADLFRSGRVPRKQLAADSDVITAKAADADLTAAELADRVRSELEGENA